MLQISRLKPHECVTVAAHACDLRGARFAERKKVCMYRWAEIIREYQEKMETESGRHLPHMNHLDAAILSL